MKYFCLVCIVLALAVSCLPGKDDSLSFLDVIPKEASVIIKINKLSSFKSELKNNDLVNTWMQSKSAEGFLNKVSALRYIESDSAGVLAFFPSEVDTLNYIFITPEQSLQALVIKILDSIPESVSYQGRDFNKYSSEGSVFYSTLFRHFVFIGNSYELIHTALKELPNDSPDELLASLFATSIPEKSGTVFLQTKKSESFIATVLNKESQINLSDFAEWMSLDLASQQDIIQLNGVSLVRDTTQHFVSLFADTSPVPSSIPSIAPGDADAILSYSFSDERIFARNQEQYYPSSMPGDSIFHTVEEVGVIFSANKKAIVLNTFGASGISQFLDDATQASYEYQGKEIGKVGYNTFLEQAFPSLIKGFKANYYVLLENAFVFSEEKDLMETLIRNLNSGTTFDKSSTYVTAKSNLAEESTLLYIANSKGFKDVLELHLSKDLYDEYQNANYSDYVLAFQMVADQNFYHINAFVKKKSAEQKRNSITPLFTLELDADIAGVPQFVINHRTKKKEIVIQDVDNNLYLISTAGKVLWKKQLEGRVQFPVQQIDLYKNGRLQLAFTTSNQFLVLDRNGKEVLPFNKSYPGANLNPLAVFDYEGTRNYRFIVTQGSSVFMYNGKGKTVEGFKYTKAESPILGIPKHFRIGSKDYLVFKLENGTLEILNRVGKTRIPVKEPIEFSDNEVFLNNNKFIVTDKTGTLFAIDTKGKIAKTRFNLNEDHGMDATIKTLSLMNDNELTIKGNKAILDLGVYTRPRIFYIYDKIYVSVTDIQTQRAYLFDSNAIAIPNFPVFANSPIDLTDMDNDRSLEIVANFEDNSIIVYRLN